MILMEYKINKGSSAIPHQTVGDYKRDNQLYNERTKKVENYFHLMFEQAGGNEHAYFLTCVIRV